MKKYYNCPEVELVTVNVAYGVCQTVSTATLNYGDPIPGADPGDGR